MLVDRIWTKARLLPCTGAAAIDDALVASLDGRIVYAGSIADAPAGLDALDVHDCDGRWITPGLIDCHTHLVHGGDRAAEFEARLAGASYEDIARAGGGIVASVAATRAATEAELVAQALPRLDALLAEGVTTIEIKSGYGLDLANECKQLRAARELGVLRAVGIEPTLLGAHALPPEATSADAYIDTVCDAMIPLVAASRLATAVDAFCEGIGFTPAQVAKVFTAARAHGLHVKLHADQLSNLEGAALAARFGALSADHLEYTSAEGVLALADAGTVAVLLPGAYYFMRETRLPPIDALRAAGVPLAVATDCNPGTAPLTSLLAAMNMAATLFRLTVDECLMGVTANAARALGRGDIGSVAAGKQCDLAIWDIQRPAELVYRLGFNPLHARIVKGVPA
ncbi:MAG: imidazolonepropionase [Polymorphobacter sp.]